jgi:hypothetical protein
VIAKVASALRLTPGKSHARSVYTARRGGKGSLTLALSGGRRGKRGGHRKQAKRACGRPLERGVRQHLAPGPNDRDRVGSQQT